MVFRRWSKSFFLASDLIQYSAMQYKYMPPHPPDGILQHTVNTKRKKCRFGWQTLIFLSVIPKTLTLLLLLAQLCSRVSDSPVTSCMKGTLVHIKNKNNVNKGAL